MVAARRGIALSFGFLFSLLLVQNEPQAHFGLRHPSGEGGPLAVDEESRASRAFYCSRSTNCPQTVGEGFALPQAAHTTPQRLPKMLAQLAPPKRLKALCRGRAKPRSAQLNYQKSALRLIFEVSYAPTMLPIAPREPWSRLPTLSYPAVGAGRASFAG